MASHCDIDDPKNLQSFRDYMGIHKRSSGALSGCLCGPLFGSESAKQPVKEHENPNVSTPRLDAPIEFPSKVSEYMHSSPSPGSPSSLFQSTPRSGQETAETLETEVKGPPNTPATGFKVSRASLSAHDLISSNIIGERNVRFSTSTGILKPQSHNIPRIVVTYSPSVSQSSGHTSPIRGSEPTFSLQPTIQLSKENLTSSTESAETVSPLSGLNQSSPTLITSDSTNTLPPTSVPPHLRGQGVETQPKMVSHNNHEATLKAIKEESPKPDQSNGDKTLKPSPKISDAHSRDATSTTNGTAMGSTQLPDTIAKSILLQIEAIETLGYLGVEDLALLHKIRDSVNAHKTQAQETPTASQSVKTSPTSPVDDKNVLPSITVSPTDGGDSLGDTSVFDKLMSEAASLKEKVLGVGNKPPKPTQASMPAAPVRDNKAVSVKPKTSTTASALPAGKENEKDREHEIYFDVWGEREVRDGPAAQVRKVLITDLPSNATPSLVAGLIYGGVVEDIHLRVSPSGIVSATVLFLHAEDCKKYYEKTANGVVYAKDANKRDMVAFVDMGKDVDVVGGLLHAWIGQGATRCVRAVSVDKDLPIDRLKQMAEDKGRKLEAVKDAVNARGLRVVVWRFCKMQHAVAFKASLTRDENFEQCNIQFDDDPCATATGVHLSS